MHACCDTEDPAADTAALLSVAAIFSGKKVEGRCRYTLSEVIIPFYAARSPDKCKLITRKLAYLWYRCQEDTGKSHRVARLRPLTTASVPKPRRKHCNGSHGR